MRFVFLFLFVACVALSLPALSLFSLSSLFSFAILPPLLTFSSPHPLPICFAHCRRRCHLLNFRFFSFSLRLFFFCFQRCRLRLLICLFVYLSASLMSVFLSLCLSVCLPVSFSVCLCLSLFVQPTKVHSDVNVFYISLALRIVQVLPPFKHFSYPPLSPRLSSPLSIVSLNTSICRCCCCCCGICLFANVSSPLTLMTTMMSPVSAHCLTPHPPRCPAHLLSLTFALF